MKRFLALALCAFVACQAEARTLYVDCHRPNNSGNGLSAKKAKKTLQAAVNIAKKGDTILVDYGTYAPIKTKNKKIKIKSIEGCYETRICRSRTKSPLWCLDLAQWNGSSCKGGRATAIWGFRCLGEGLKGDNGSWGVAGGTVRDCEFADFHVGSKGWAKGKSKKPVFWKTSLESSVLLNCYQNTELNDLLRGCTVRRCRLVNCASRIRSSKLVNTFVGGCARPVGTKFVGASKTTPDDDFYDCAYSFRNVTWHGDNGAATTYGCFFQNSKLYNCTVVHGNSGRFTKFFKSSKAWNTVFWEVPSSIFSKRKSLKNSFSNCYEGGPDPRFVQTKRNWVDGYWVDGYWVDGYWDDFTGEYVDGYYVEGYSIDGYYEDPDFRLQDVSPCIDAGRLTKTLKKIVGSKDLDGGRRVAGRRIDIGCYEFD